MAPRRLIVRSATGAGAEFWLLPDGTLRTEWEAPLEASEAKEITVADTSPARDEMLEASSEVRKTCDFDEFMQGHDDLLEDVVQGRSKANREAAAQALLNWLTETLDEWRKAIGRLDKAEDALRDGDKAALKVFVEVER